MGIKIRKDNKKIRVNITVDKELLGKAKDKLDMFGGKVSTLFNAYLRDFVSSMDKNYNENVKQMQDKIKELEERLKRIEKDKKQ